MMLADPAAIAAAYTGTRTRSTELLRTAGVDAVAEQVVPACPQWTVRQLASHMCGVCDDVLGGNVAEAGTDPWTDAQVARYADTSLADILDHWDEVGPQVEAVIPAVPPAPASQMVFDVTTHEHDLRGALDRPGARDSDSIVVGLGFLAKSLDRLIKAQGLPTLQITAANRVLRGAVRFGARAGALAPPQAWRRASRPLLRALKQPPARRPPLSYEQRRGLGRVFADDIDRLERVLGQSFAAWRSQRRGETYSVRSSWAT